MVPTIFLTTNGIEIEVDHLERIKVGSLSEITPALDEVRTKHKTNGSWLLSPGPTVPYNDLIRTMDAARAADFPAVTVIGGVLATNSIKP